MGSGQAPSEGAAGAVSMGTHGPNGSHGLWGRGRVSGPGSGTADPQIGWYESHKSYGLGAEGWLSLLATTQRIESRTGWRCRTGTGPAKRSSSLALDGFAGLADWLAAGLPVSPSCRASPRRWGQGGALGWLDIDLLGMPRIPAKAGKCKGQVPGRSQMQGRGLHLRPHGQRVHTKEEIGSKAESYDESERSVVF